MKMILHPVPYIKQMRISIAVILLLFFLDINAAESEEIISPGGTVLKKNYNGKPLTEQQVIETALKNSEKLKSLNTNEEIADHRYNSSGWIRNPELRMGEETKRYFTKDYDELETGLRWRIPKLGALGEEKQQARVELWKRKIEKIRYQHRLTARVRKSFANAVMYDSLVELAAQRVDKENDRINIIQQMVDLGSRSVVYFTKAKMWNAESKNNYARTVQNQGLARRSLSKRSGIPEDAVLLVKELPELEQDLDVLIELAYACRPEIKLVDQRIELAQRQENLEKYKLVPWLTFVEFSYHFEKKRKNDWKEVMLGISLPLFNWNLGNIRATKLAVKKKQGESEAIKESIADEVRSAYIIYKDLFLDWKNFKTYADELIANAQIVVQNARQHETLLPDEVLEMELTVLETKKLLTEKKRDLTYALIELYYAVGIEGHERLVR